MFHSIRWRLTWPYVALLLAAVIGLGAYFVDYWGDLQMANLEANLLEETRLLAEVARGPLAGGVDVETLDQLAKRWAELSDKRVTIIDAEGVVLGESHDDRSSMDNHLDRPEVVAAAQEGQGSSVRFSSTLGARLMYLALPVESGGRRVGFVRLATPMETIEANLARLRRSVLWVVLVASGLAVVLASWIAERTTRPIRQLTRNVLVQAGDDQARDLIPGGGDEVDRLRRAIAKLTTRQQTQLAGLRSERTKLTAILQQMTDGVVMVDSLGQVKLLNLAAQRIFGVREAQAVGRSLAEATRLHQLVDLWKSCLESGQEQAAYLELVSARLFLQVVAIPFEEPLVGNVLLLIQDLSHMRRLETARRDFVSNISHELRTPLAALKALVETLQAGAFDDPPAAQRFLQQMGAELDSLAQLVSELLELSRIESGRVPLELDAVPPRHLLQSAMDRLRLQAERAGLEMGLACPDDLPLVLADPTRVEQVLVNLLHNAIKFTPRGGQVELGARTHDGQILFWVRDSGVGIPADDLPRVFERFYKTDQARSGGGTGLGLAIARHLVEAHGGKIWVESAEGEGSTFYFTLLVYTD